MSSPSLAARAFLALVLMIGFYVLAVAMAGGLLFIPYAELAYANRVHPKLALICIISAGAILWSIVPRRDTFTPPGPRLDPERQPRLFAQVFEVATAAEQDMPAEVYLVPDVNAWVGQRGGIMGLGSRRVMGLGLPLLQVLSVSELRAVLAHEFGHYHGGDTMLGPWVYKTRGTIERTLQGLHQSWLQFPFLWYGNMFLRVTHAVSRRQEFAADALASRVVGSRPLVSGLRAIHGASVAFDPYWSNEVTPALNAGYRPSLASGYARFLQAEPIATVVARSLEAELHGSVANPYDTHPSLRDRIAAIADLPHGAEVTDDSPAISLLNNVPHLETQLLATMFGAEPVGQLQPVDWDDVGTRVYLPIWEGMLRPLAADLKGVTPLSFPKLASDLSSFGSRLAQTAQRSLGPDEATPYAIAILGSALLVALQRQGWSIDAAPGKAVAARRVVAGTDEEQRVEPFHDLDRLQTSTLSAEDWNRRCEALGIGELDLGEVAGAIPVAAS